MRKPSKDALSTTVGALFGGTVLAQVDWTALVYGNRQERILAGIGGAIVLLGWLSNKLDKPQAKGESDERTKENGTDAAARAKGGA